MNLELDHIFLATVEAETVQNALTEFGMVFSRRSRHPGQGTANACALFDNAYLEILWPDSMEEVDSDLVRPLGLWERSRCKETGACPFGISFRPTAHPYTLGSFETWGYAPPYLPKGSALPIITPKRALFEPLIFISAGGKAPSPSVEYDFLQCGSRRRLTRVRITRPDDGPTLSPGLLWLCRQGLISIENGDSYRMDLEWDHDAKGGSRKFNWPTPLTFRW